MLGNWRGQLGLWSKRIRAKKHARLDHPVASGIGDEAPIRTASQDRLRRVDFAGRIASVLSELQPSEGRVFAIRGGWGFGKSSLKNLVTERIDAEDNGADWLDFNPWQWGDGESIARALFGQLADKLGSESSTGAAGRAKSLRKYGAILTGTAGPLKEVSGSLAFITALLTNVSVVALASAAGLELPSAAQVAAVLAILSLAIPIVGKALTYWGRDRTAAPLSEVRFELENRLRKLKRPLVVFVDDIDRLEPEQIRMLLRQVKANVNLPNIVFVLLFQRSIVERALDPVADGDGRAFLEKLVQTNFDLPWVPPSVVHRIFSEELSTLAGTYATEENGFKQTRWGNIFVGCIQPRIRNMRDARRLISSIDVHLPLHADGSVYEVNILDFFALETLRVFEPFLHETLFQERELVLQARRFQGDGRSDADRESIKKLLETVSSNNRDWAQDTLKELFPAIEWAFGGSHYGGDWYATWLKAKRVCSPRYFPRYFELQTALGELSESAFVHFLEATADPDQLTTAVTEIEANNLLHSLVARLDESVERLPVENAANLLPVMFLIGQKLAGTREADPFSSPWVSAWRATSWYLKRIPEDNRGRLAITALEKSEALSVAATLIHLNDPADHKDKENGNFDPALDGAAVEGMKKEWLRQIRKRASSLSQLLAEPDLASLLYRWRDYAGSIEEPRALATNIIKTDAGFVTLVGRLMGRGTRQSFGDRVATPYFSFNRDTIEDFIGIQTAKDKLDLLDLESFSDDQIALQTLNRHLEVWLGMRKADSFDF